LLSHALWQIRRVFENALPTRASPPAEIRSTGDLISFVHTSRCEIDALLFENKVQCAMAEAASDTACDRSLCDHLSVAAACYGGPLLEGEEADWILAERERLHSSWLGALVELMRAQARLERFEDAAATAQRILRHDSLREGVHRDRMLLLTLAGRRGEALHQYERCRTILETELGIAPLIATREMAEKIRNGSISEHGNTLANTSFSKLR
jgi:DNA-binding SARP family transcriptional activator